jgi:hypothetical protein
MIRLLLRSAAYMENTLVPIGTVNTKSATALRGEVLFPTCMWPGSKQGVCNRNLEELYVFARHKYWQIRRPPA